jgi:hypothetical protein
MKEYRQNSHTRSLIVWTILCTATALVLFYHSHKIVSRALRTEEILAGVALLIFGPAALAAYLLRARRVWVSVDQIRGIVVAGGRVIPWEEVLRVDRRRPAFRKSSGPIQVPEMGASDALGSAGSGCLNFGCLAGVGEIFAGLLLLVAAVYVLWLLIFVVIPLVALVVLEVFAPFGDRIRIVTRGRTIVLHDLSDADEFMRVVAHRRPAAEQ